MLFLLTIALAANVQPELTSRHYCDIIEVNTVYSETDGTERFTQVIFWEWRQALNYQTGKQEWGHFVQEWRIIKGEAKDKRPRYDYRRKLYVLTFLDDRSKRYRTIYSVSSRSTETFYDVEVEDRKRLPPHARRKLFHN